MPQSIIIIPVPAAEPVVEALRKKYDAVSLHGMPSHITLLFPFKDPSLIHKEVIQKIDKLFSIVRQFPFALEKINTFPNVIFLEPNSRITFINLTKAIARVFPEHLPWEGKFPKINPHLTIGSSIEKQNMNLLRRKIKKIIRSKLPIQTTATEAWLMINNNDGWEIKRKFKFKKIT